MPYRPEKKKPRRRKQKMLEYELQPLTPRLTSAEKRAFKREGTDFSGPKDYLRRTIARARAFG